MAAPYQQQPLAGSNGYVEQPMVAPPHPAGHVGGAGGHSEAAMEAEQRVSHGMGAKEAKNMQKVLEKEQKREDGSIKSQVKEISKAEKAEHHAQKADEKAIKEHSKAVEKEHKLAREVEKLQAKHDQALRETQKTAHDIELHKQHHQSVTGHLQQSKAHLDELTHAREAHTAEREPRINELSGIVNAAKNK